jgi:hypothetical protein
VAFELTRLLLVGETMSSGKQHHPRENSPRSVPVMTTHVASKPTVGLSAGETTITARQNLPSDRSPMSAPIANTPVVSAPMAASSAGAGAIELENLQPQVRTRLLVLARITHVLSAAIPFLSAGVGTVRDRCHLCLVRSPQSEQAVVTLAVSEPIALLSAGAATRMDKLRHLLVRSARSQSTQSTHVGFVLTAPLPVGVDPTGREQCHLLEAPLLPLARAAITSVESAQTTLLRAGEVTTTESQHHLESIIAPKFLGKDGMQREVIEIDSDCSVSKDALRILIRNCRRIPDE